MKLSAVRTLPELLAFRVAQSPQGEAYREFDSATGQWVSTRWAGFSERVTQWRHDAVSVYSLADWQTGWRQARGIREL